MATKGDINITATMDESDVERGAKKIKGLIDSSEADNPANYEQYAKMYEGLASSFETFKTSENKTFAEAQKFLQGFKTLGTYEKGFLGGTTKDTTELINQSKALTDILPKVNDTTQSVSNIGKVLNKATSGFAYMFASVVPGGYALIRMKTGLTDIGQSIGEVTTDTGAAAGAFSGLDAILGTTLLVIGAIVIILGALVVVLGAVVLGVINWGKSMYDTLANSLFPFSTFYDKMLNLQTALNNLRAAWLGVFANLLNAAMPVILNIINWLTNLLNRLSMVIAALTGAKTALIGVGVEATHAGNAAKDMVAPFDKLNVLQQDNNLMMLKQVPIDPDILAGVDKFRKLWEDTKKAAQDALIWIVSTWGQFATWFNANVWQPLIPKLGEIWSTIQKNMEAFYNSVLLPIWTGIAAWFAKEWTDIAAVFQNAWNIIVDIIKIAWAIIVGLISFDLDMINGRWGAAWNDLKVMWSSIWSAIVDIGKSSVDLVIAILNVLIAAFIQIVNGFANAYNMIAGLGIVPWAIKNIPVIAAPKIPYLATGAVIPPNAAFMAILGDQSAGKNIEAPESLLRQIVGEELSKQTVNINFTGSLSQLAKVLKPEFDRENVRVGNSLVKRTGQVPIS